MSANALDEKQMLHVRALVRQGVFLATIATVMSEMLNLDNSNSHIDTCKQSVENLVDKEKHLLDEIASIDPNWSSAENLLHCLDIDKYPSWAECLTK